MRGDSAHAAGAQDGGSLCARTLSGRRNCRRPTPEAAVGTACNFDVRATHYLPVAMNYRSVWAILHQSAMRRSLLAALPCAVVAAVMKYADLNMEFNFLVSIMPEDATYSSFTFLLGFFLCFHTSHAYQRFWYGAQMIYTISGNFIDMASLLLAFTQHSSQPKELISNFKAALVRLSSLLFAVSIDEVCGRHELHISDRKCIDACGLDEGMLERVRISKHKAQVVCLMIQNLIVSQISAGVLNIPPPILTRAFQEQSNAMIQFHEVRTCREVPFPFPFVIVSEVLLLFHWGVTPFFMSYWSQGSLSAATYTFIISFTLWTMHYIAMELDNPFGGGINDLDTAWLQDQLDEQLVTLLMESEACLTVDKQQWTMINPVVSLVNQYQSVARKPLPCSWPEQCWRSVPEVPHGAPPSAPRRRRLVGAPRQGGNAEANEAKAPGGGATQAGASPCEEGDETVADEK
ncbi:unnamed protein product [Prorocentrum cordatum]|uniref:Bestrophin homolog n=1 Tax=Prorocentrum cordatum TaxID=2364126 RepID=A0ABN9QAI3_9DINO|nr:unnamed protein product [Polarella glacialis]